MILGFKVIVLAMVIVDTIQKNAGYDGVNTALTTAEPQSKTGDNETIAHYDEQEGRNILSDFRIKMTGGVSPGQRRPSKKKQAEKYLKRQKEKLAMRKDDEDDYYEDDD